MSSTFREIEEQFRRGLVRMFPDIDWPSIESIHVNHAGRIQPLQVLDYSRLVPDVTTNYRDFFVLNTSQFVNATQTNNEVVGTVNDFLDRHGSLPARPAIAAVGAA